MLGIEEEEMSCIEWNDIGQEFLANDLDSSFQLQRNSLKLTKSCWERRYIHHFFFLLGRVMQKATLIMVSEKQGDSIVVGSHTYNNGPSRVWVGPLVLQVPVSFNNIPIHALVDYADSSCCNDTVFKAKHRILCTQDSLQVQVYSKRNTKSSVPKN